MSLTGNYTFVGHGDWSLDAVGGSATAGGDLTVRVPTGSHVEAAFLYEDEIRHRASDGGNPDEREPRRRPVKRRFHGAGRGGRAASPSHRRHQLSPVDRRLRLSDRLHRQRFGGQRPDGRLRPGRRLLERRRCGAYDPVRGRGQRAGGRQLRRLLPLAGGHDGAQLRGPDVPGHRLQLPGQRDAAILPRSMSTATG